MHKRPVCCVCVFLMLFLCILDLAGVSIVRGNPLPAKGPAMDQSTSIRCHLRGSTAMSGHGVFSFCLSETSLSD